MKDRSGFTLEDQGHLTLLEPEAEGTTSLRSIGYYAINGLELGPRGLSSAAVPLEEPQYQV